MCRTADNIFDGGLSDVRGDREYQRSRGYKTPPNVQRVPQKREPSTLPPPYKADLDAYLRDKNWHG